MNARDKETIVVKCKQILKRSIPQRHKHYGGQNRSLESSIIFRQITAIK
jgi:hypothetical protein